MKILFLVPYPVDEAPSQRFRFEQYYSILTGKGYRYATQSFLSLKAWKSWYHQGGVIAKTVAIISGYVRRLLILFTLPAYDFVFIHREAAPVGPPVFEWIIRKIFNKKIIYDFDDAIWLTDNTTEHYFQKAIRWRSKVGSICKWSYKVSCGNNYLADYARQFNQHVVVNPTTIDTSTGHNPELFSETKTSQEVVIGWTGSHSTLKYLTEAERALQEIERNFPNVRFMIIADQKPALKLNNILFAPWNKNSEVRDLLKIDIGIMPLPDDDWSKGKCGFKALQYMALGIPTVASPVGVNTSIIDHGQNGFLCSGKEEWISSLTNLIEDEALRKSFGQNGRKKIIDQFSVLSNTARFLSLFQ